MIKAFYIVGIVFSVLFLGISGYYMEEVSVARWDYMFSDYDWMGYDDYDYMAEDRYRSLTVVAGLWSLFFFLSFLAIQIVGMIKVKTTTTKVLSIIGVSITGIFFIWNLGVMSSPGAMSFDEVAPAWFLFCFIMLAFTIVGLVQSVKFEKRGLVKSKVAGESAGDLLD